MALAVSIAQQLDAVTQWRDAGGWVIALFFVLTFVIGVLLLRSTHRRWLSCDVA
jgi:uncharacterized membrane protein HdeD (DUF308 family)